DGGASLGDEGDHFLFAGDGHGAALFGIGAGDADVGVGLGDLQLRADVESHIDVGDVDGNDLEGGLRVEAPLDDLAGDQQRVGECLPVAFARADRRDDRLA